MRLTAAAAAVVYEYVSMERCAPSALFLVSKPSPRQPTAVVWPRRETPSADYASGATQRRYPAASPSNSSIVLLLFAVVNNILNLETMPFFDLKL